MSRTVYFNGSLVVLHNEMHDYLLIILFVLP